MTRVQPPDGRPHASAPRTVDDAAVRSAKILLRRAVALRRDLRSDEARRTDDANRFAVLRHQLAGRRPRTVAAYLSAGSEPGTLQLVAWLASQDIPVLLPVLTGDDGTSALREPVWARFAGADALRIGRYAILEPTTAPEPPGALERADLIICTGSAANAAGDRLGRGAGWYDRALRQAGPGADIWLLLNDDEVLEAIPTQPWDRRVTALVTPTRFISC